MMTTWHGNAFHITASGDFYSTGASNAVLNFCLGLPEQAVEKPVEFTDGFPHKGTVQQSFDVFNDASLDKLL